MSQDSTADDCAQGGHLLVEMKEKLSWVVEVDQALGVRVQRANVLVVAQLTGENDLHLLMRMVEYCMDPIMDTIMIKRLFQARQPVDGFSTQQASRQHAVLGLSGRGTPHSPTHCGLSEPELRSILIPAHPGQGVCAPAGATSRRCPLQRLGWTLLQCLLRARGDTSEPLSCQHKPASRTAACAR